MKRRQHTGVVKLLCPGLRRLSWTWISAADNFSPWVPSASAYMRQNSLTTHRRTTVHDRAYGRAVALAVGRDTEKSSKGRHRKKTATTMRSVCALRLENVQLMLWMQVDYDLAFVGCGSSQGPVI